MNNTAIDEIVLRIQKNLNITIDSSEIYRISRFVEDINCDPFLVEKAYEQAYKNARPKHINYILCILRNWNDRNIKTIDDYNKQIASNLHSEKAQTNIVIDSNSDKYSIIATELGLKRKLTYFEEAVVESWTEGYGLNLDQILIFCKITRKKAKYSSLQYCDTFIDNIMRNDR